MHFCLYPFLFIPGLPEAMLVLENVAQSRSFFQSMVNRVFLDTRGKAEDSLLNGISFKFRDSLDCFVSDKTFKNCLEQTVFLLYCPTGKLLTGNT